MLKSNYVSGWFGKCEVWILDSVAIPHHCCLRRQFLETNFSEPQNSTKILEVIVPNRVDFACIPQISREFVVIYQWYEMSHRGHNMWTMKMYVYKHAYIRGIDLPQKTCNDTTHCKHNHMRDMLVYPTFRTEIFRKEIHFNNRKRKHGNTRKQLNEYCD